MSAPPDQGVEVERQRGDQGFAFAGLHLGNSALVQDDAANELDIVMAQPDRAHRGLADEGKCVDQDIFKVGAILQLRFEVGGPSFHLLVAEPLHGRLQRIDLVYRLLIA